MWEGLERGFVIKSIFKFLDAYVGVGKRPKKWKLLFWISWLSHPAGNLQFHKARFVSKTIFHEFMIYLLCLDLVPATFWRNFHSKIFNWRPILSSTYARFSAAETGSFWYEIIQIGLTKYIKIQFVESSSDQVVGLDMTSTVNMKIILDLDYVGRRSHRYIPHTNHYY